MRLTILHIKLVHTLIFVILSGCVLLVLYSGLVGSITSWTWAAVVLILLEGVTLVAFGWKCPLTLVAERLGAHDGAVVDIFLPKWLADRIFPICGTTFLVGCVLILWRLWRQ